MGAVDGKRALVTGGSRGIGAAVAQRLAREGADVALTYNASPDSAHEVGARIEREGRRAVVLRADVRDPSAVEASVDAAAEALGGIDVLVSSAGSFVYAPIEELRTEDYDSLTALHVRSVFVAVRRVLAHMPDGGRIVTIGSNLSERVPMPGLSLYALTKSALTGFTKGLARDLGPRGITVNVVHPGSTDTEMNPADGPDADGERALTALGRYGRPEEIAATVAHLVGSAAGFLTGTSVTVDGGANA